MPRIRSDGGGVISPSARAWSNQRWSPRVEKTVDIAAMLGPNDCILKKRLVVIGTADR